MDLDVSKWQNEIFSVENTVPILYNWPFPALLIEVLDLIIN